MRKSGILLHLSSLNGSFGIGTLGKESYDFIDFLKQSGVSCWQMLPIGPTGFGDSPYQPFSTFAGNPYFISPELLFEDGLIDNAALSSIERDAAQVDYCDLYNGAFDLLRTAFENFEPSDDYHSFVCREWYWLNDYALFMALKAANDNQSWEDWLPSHRMRDFDAIRAFEDTNRREIDFWKFVQYEFFKQWFALKDYAEQNGIELIGDLPIYVALDSADVWSHPEQFQLDDERHPKAVAGCPPDYFSKTGQLWGNPLYDWEAMKCDGYSWWVSRIKHQSRMFDRLRIDHFRGFEAYWSVPAGDETAENGCWVKGPGIELFDAIKRVVGDIPIIAEDLGIITDEVRALLKQTGYPGMKVLEFAFTKGYNSDYLPFNHVENCICYTGTHDNDTLLGWLSAESEENLEYIYRYTHTDSLTDCVNSIIDLAWSSRAKLCVVPMQDLLCLNSDARMNTPSVSEGNWTWRLPSNALTEELKTRLVELKETFFR